VPAARGADSSVLVVLVVAIEFDSAKIATHAYGAASDALGKFELATSDEFIADASTDSMLALLRDALCVAEDLSAFAEYVERSEELAGLELVASTLDVTDAKELVASLLVALAPFVARACRSSLSGIG
jgi:hypothetical protein